QAAMRVQNRIEQEGLLIRIAHFLRRDRHGRTIAPSLATRLRQICKASSWWTPSLRARVRAMPATMKKPAIEAFFRRLAEALPEPKGELIYVNPYTLLVAV